MGTLWAIQKHESSPAPRVLFDACQRMAASVAYEAWKDEEIPDLSTDSNAVFYGSCSFIENITSNNRWRPGIYFDSGEFRYSRHLAEYGVAMLNSDCVITDLASIECLGLLANRKLFVRSENDSKKLSGSIWTNDQLLKYLRQLESVGNGEMLRHPIVVAPKKTIDYEWRLFLVDGRVSAGSQYRYFGDLCCAPELPDSVRLFAERLAACWSPSPVFVMDIAKYKDSLYVLELNGFNSCGFYSSDVAQIVRDVQLLISRGANSN